jgi:hypothetical protein
MLMKEQSVTDYVHSAMTLQTPPLQQQPVSIYVSPSKEFSISYKHVTKSIK